MKMIALAAALLASSAAFAQTTPATPPADAMQTPPAPPADPAMTPPPAPPSDPAAPMPPAPPPSTEMAAPAAPMAPMAEPAPAPVAQASYPRCSATVTDQCRQNSARESDRKGGPRKRRG